MVTTETTPHYARVMLSVMGEGYRGYASDSATGLVLAALRLDDDNLERLALGFSELVGAVRIYRHIGVDELVRIASGDQQ